MPNYRAEFYDLIDDHDALVCRVHRAEKALLADRAALNAAEKALAAERVISAKLRKGYAELLRSVRSTVQDLQRAENHIAHLEAVLADVEDAP